MDPLSLIAGGLANLGYGIASNAAYDYLKMRFKGRAEASSSELQAAISDYLVIKNVKANASTVMELLANKGLLQVSGSHLYAPIQLTMGAAQGAVFVASNTTTRTDTTAIIGGPGASIRGSNAEVRQNPDGSIRFHTGGDGSIGFYTGGKR